MWNAAPTSRACAAMATSSSHARHAIARAAQRQLDDDRRERLVLRSELREGERIDECSDARHAQAVQRADRVVLVFDDVRARVRRDDVAPAAVRVHAQRG